MTKIEIKNRWTGIVIYSCDVPDDVPSGMALRHALEKAVVSNSNLRNSDLSGSDLSGSNLRNSDLSGSDLSGSNLRNSDLSGSNLSGSDLSGSNLINQKNDFWAILLHATKEISGLRLALVEGRVDGSTYEGKCACLVGTIGNVRGVNYKDIGVKPDSSRPAERWFLGIKKGDTPETNQISRITVDWLDEFVGLLEASK